MIIKSCARLHACLDYTRLVFFFSVKRAEIRKSLGETRHKEIQGGFNNQNNDFIIYNTKQRKTLPETACITNITNTSYVTRAFKHPNHGVWP